ncbi:MAG: ABC transporter substrate-binding protein [Flavobacteriales bacterium]|nr:ABC transporter substrate-binding protein [Flavobacteriales bacterium]
MRIKECIYFAAILVIVGCSNGRNSGEGKTVFRYNEPGGIVSLDPAYAGNVEDMWVISQMFNGLVQMDETLGIQPSIAKSWEVSEDGLVYRFSLRDDVFFHDHELFKEGKGRKVVASDFVNSYFRLTDMEVASTGGWLLKNIDDSEKSNHLGFVAENDSTLKIFLKRPSSSFLSKLTMAYFSVVPYEIVEHYGKEFRRNPIGTGPFKFKLWKEGIKIVLVKNDSYFEFEDTTRLPYLDAVAISFSSDPQRNVEFLEFLKGNLDCYSGQLPPSLKDEVFHRNGELTDKYKGRIKVEKQTWLKTDYLGFLMDESLDMVKGSPYAIKEVRQAINYGINKKKLIEYVRGGIGYPAISGFVPKGMPSYNEKIVKGFAYDPDKSRALLRKAGFPNGEGLPKLSLGMTTTEKEIYEFVQGQLADIGIEIELNINPTAIHRQKRTSSGLNFFQRNWVGDYRDAANFLGLFYSPNPNSLNNTRFNNKEFDALYEKAIIELNDSIRHTYHQKMDSILVEEAPIVPLFYDEVLFLTQKNVEGLGTNPLKALVLKRVQITN